MTETPSYDLATELRLMQQALVVEDARRRLTRGAVLVLVSSLLAAAGAIVCAALDVGAVDQGGRQVEASPEPFVWAIVPLALAFVLALAALLWPLDRDATGAARDRGATWAARLAGVSLVVGVALLVVAALEAV